MLELALTKEQFDKWDSTRQQKYFEKHPDSSFLPPEKRKNRIKSRPATLEEKINTRKKRAKKKLISKWKKIKNWYNKRKESTDTKKLYGKVIQALDESGVISLPSRLLFGAIFGPIGNDLHKLARTDEKLKEKLLERKGITKTDYEKMKKGKDGTTKQDASESSIQELESLAKKGYKLMRHGNKEASIYSGAKPPKKPEEVWDKKGIDTKYKLEQIKAGTKVKVFEYDTSSKVWKLLKTIHVK